MKRYELIARLYDNWRAWGSPINRETCINETCMAMDCKEAGEELERYKQALTRANGFLIMHDLEPVKLEAAPTENPDLCPHGIPKNRNNVDCWECSPQTKNPSRGGA